MLLRRHWQGQEEETPLVPDQEPPKNEEAAPGTPKRRGRPKKGE